MDPDVFATPILLSAVGRKDRSRPQQELNLDSASAPLGADQCCMQEDQAGELIHYLGKWCLAAVCLKGNRTISWEGGGFPHSLGKTSVSASVTSHFVGGWGWVRKLSGNGPPCT